MSAFGIYLRGLLMGAADIVPGVSGGTIAFITGIYPRLLASIRSVDLAFVRQVLSGDIKGAWQHIDGNFLLALVGGIATSILTLARVLAWLLEHHPVPLWAFFFGLILASALILLRQVGNWSAGRIVLLLVGAGSAVAIGLSPIAAIEPSLPYVFFSGFLAICAMILPGISGSFILVLLGMYAVVLGALRSFDLLFIVVFAAGAACGLMCFSRLLHWLLARFQQATMAVLTGFLFGSLTVVWPWKQVLDWITGSHGQLKPARQIPVLPDEYLLVTGQDPQVLLCVTLAIVGFAMVWYLDSKWGSDNLPG